MVHLTLYLENETYHNILFFHSNNKKEEVWTIDNHPLIINQIKKTHPTNFEKYKYFFFRTLYEDNIDHDYCEIELRAICTMMLTKKAIPALSKYHPHKWIRILTDSISKGKFDKINFTDNENFEVVKSPSLFEKTKN